MPDLTAIAQGFSALKALKDIAEATMGLRDATAFRERQIEFQGKIIEAQTALFALQDERSSLIEKIGELEKEITGLKAWEAEKQRYELNDVGLGSLAYTIKDGMRGTEPPHNICANCCQRGNKSILQPQDISHDKMLVCNECDAKIKIADLPWVAVF